MDAVLGDASGVNYVLGHSRLSWRRTPSLETFNWPFHGFITAILCVSWWHLVCLRTRSVSSGQEVASQQTTHNSLLCSQQGRQGATLPPVREKERARGCHTQFHPVQNWSSRPRSPLQSTLIARHLSLRARAPSFASRCSLLLVPPPRTPHGDGERAGSGQRGAHRRSPATPQSASKHRRARCRACWSRSARQDQRLLARAHPGRHAHAN